MHLRFNPIVALGSDSMQIGCEVQIRTRLQDAWGELSRADIYKNQDALPGSLIGQMERLAKALARADRIADQIRQQVSRPYRGRRPPEGAPLSASALAFIYRRAFGADPPVYLVESVLNEFGGLPVRAESVDRSVADRELRERLRAAYFESVPKRSHLGAGAVAVIPLGCSSWCAR